MKKYTQREFLKMMGLGIAFLPFISCFHSGNQDEQQDKNTDSLAKPPSAKEKTPLEKIKVTADDVVLLTRDDGAYTKLNEGYNKRIHFLPQYIALCQTEKGVQYALQKAMEEKLKVAVKSGGHSFEGFSSNDGGMVINLSRMKKITFGKNDTALVEPGCLLKDIQDTFFARKRLLPAGSCGTVGIAGLTLGGGYGFFSREYGLTCDSLIQARIVTADGKVHDTDDDNDLLWACRGGGNGNFGVVTSFTFRHYTMPPTFNAYTLKYNGLTTDRFNTLLDAWFAMTQTLPKDAFSAFVLNGNFLTILVTTFKENTEIEDLLGDLIKLSGRYAKSLKKDLPLAMKRYYGRPGPLYFKNASGGMYKGIEDLNTCKEALFEKVVATPGIVYQINTLGGNVANPDFEPASCFPHRALPYLSELQSYWNTPAQADKMISKFEEIQQLLKDAGIQSHYRNYPDINFKDWENAYYGNNYVRLQALKRKYDPTDLFHYPQSIRL